MPGQDCYTSYMKVIYMYKLYNLKNRQINEDIEKFQLIRPESTRFIDSAYKMGIDVRSDGIICTLITISKTGVITYNYNYRFNPDKSRNLIILLGLAYKKLHQTKLVHRCKNGSPGLDIWKELSELYPRCIKMTPLNLEMAEFSYEDLI